MKRIKRRIIAISTALVMALALVVNFVPTDVKATTNTYYIYTLGNQGDYVGVYQYGNKPSSAIELAEIEADSLPTGITYGGQPYTVNIKDLSCEKFFTSTFTSSDLNWTFVFEGDNTVSSNINITETCTIQVKPGGKLYTNELCISNNTTLTLNQTTADKKIPKTPFSSPLHEQVFEVTLYPAISTISPTITVPAGNKTFEDETEHMGYVIVQPEDGAHYTVQSTDIVKTSDGTPYEDYPLTLEEGKEYYASVILNAEEGYGFLYDGTNLTTTVNPQGTDVSYGESGYSTYSQAKFTVKFKVPKKEPTPPTPTQHKFLNGDNQVVTYGQPVMFRLEGELSDYNGDGYIEVDGALVPAKYVAATKGSIILTLASDYVSGLKEGKHDVNIYFNDKSHVSTTFTLVKEETPTTTPTSTQNTTTKVTAPKTSDSVPFVVVGIVTLTVGIGSVVAYRKHACKGKASRFSYGDRSRK